MHGAKGLKTALDQVMKMILSGKPFLIVGAMDSKHSILMANDLGEGLKLRLADAMNEDLKLADLFEDAVIYHHLNNMLESIIPDCTTCKKQDDCKIRKEVEALGHAQEGCSAIDNLVEMIKKERSN